MRFSLQWKWCQTLQADLGYPCWEPTCHPVSHVVPRSLRNLQFSLNKAYWFFPKISAHDWHLRHTWPVTRPLLIPTNPCPLMMMDKDLAKLHAPEHVYPWSFMFSVFFLSHFIRFTWDGPWFTVLCKTLLSILDVYIFIQSCRIIKDVSDLFQIHSAARQWPQAYSRSR